MPWWVRRIAIFMLLGAIVNIAVAWGCVFAPRNIPLSSLDSTGSKPGTRFEMEGIFISGCEYVTGWRFIEEPNPYAPGQGGEMKVFIGGKWWPGDPRGSEFPSDVHHLGCGWPMLALAAVLRFDENAGSAPVEIVGGVPLEPRARMVQPGHIPKIIPFRPLWIGFAVNSIGYGLLVALFPISRRYLIRSMRRSRRQCLNCGYPRGTSPVCTECGEALA